MPPVVKFFAAMSIFAVWGPYLLYVWALPENVPSWVLQTGFRKALMLSRDFEPTVFTLMFGMMFTGFVIYGLIAFLNGNAHFQKMELMGKA